MGLARAEKASNTGRRARGCMVTMMMMVFGRSFALRLWKG